MARTYLWLTPVTKKQNVLSERREARGGIANAMLTSGELLVAKIDDFVVWRNA